MPNRGRGRRGVLVGQGVGRGVDTGDPGGPIPGDRELPGGQTSQNGAKIGGRWTWALGQGHQQSRGKVALKSLPEHFSWLLVFLKRKRGGTPASRGI